jgi:hypothetical protein
MEVWGSSLDNITGFLNGALIALSFCPTALELRSFLFETVI